MATKNIKEFIEADGTLINSKMPPNINKMATSKMTTDQHVAASRQGMVWMNYRRFYGEDNETLPYAKEADKCENNPKKFYEFLKSKGKEKEFNKYFVKKEEKKDVSTVLKEEGVEKMRKLIEDLVKKSEGNDIIKKKDDQITIHKLSERESALMKKVEAIAKSIKEAFNEEEYDLIIEYIKHLIYL